MSSSITRQDAHFGSHYFASFDAAAYHVADTDP